MTLAPNPTADFIELKVPEEGPDVMRAMVLSANGEVRLETTLPAGIGVSTSVIDVRTLPTGMYLVVVQQGNQIFKQPLSILR